MPRSECRNSCLLNHLIRAEFRQEFWSKVFLRLCVLSSPKSAHAVMWLHQRIQPIQAAREAYRAVEVPGRPKLPSNYGELQLGQSPLGILAGKKLFLVFRDRSAEARTFCVPVRLFVDAH